MECKDLEQAGKLENLKTEMQKNEVSVLGVSKVQWKRQGEIRSGDYTVYYSGGERAERGVAIVVHKSVVRSVVKKIVFGTATVCNDRIIALKLKAEPVDTLIMQVYMPTSEYENDEVEKVYNTIEDILQEDGRGDTNSIILGDWNSTVGDESYQNIVGSHGLGWKNVNNEEGRSKYRRLRNELKRATDRAKKEYLEKISNETIEFERTGRYDLMYMKIKELGWKEKHGIQNIGIEDSQGNRIVDQRQVLKICKNYITQLYDRPNWAEALEVEPEEVEDTDKKGPYTLQNEVEKAIKDMRNGKVTGDDDIPGEVLKLLGEGGLKTLTKLINTIYETGEWPKGFIEVTMIALKKKTKATKCSDNRAITLIAHTVKIIVKDT
ncbi:hypothetical protein B7P43_G12560 [Cryptotermes secundus]|uniref:Endonuclease/exonuclease/phosphatase domain-containing protein n=1 Tax=Cryptotermes secundus TaxID=105785 RepID=A0A2J7QM87_9NEOP|nr:hypothetical protein B7P43_G12560 [Cryptotermes secundus]